MIALSIGYSWGNTHKHTHSYRKEEGKCHCSAQLKWERRHIWECSSHELCFVWGILWMRLLLIAMERNALPMNTRTFNGMMIFYGKMSKRLFLSPLSASSSFLCHWHGQGRKMEQKSKITHSFLLHIDFPLFLILGNDNDNGNSSINGGRTFFLHSFLRLIQNDQKWNQQSHTQHKLFRKP